jgi:hypothetical protein
MNIKSLTLTIISVAAAVAAAQPAVQAQEEKRTPSARWDYAPNVWKKETMQLPRNHGYESGPAVNVRSGSVPRSNMLGIDPNYLAKAPAPMAAPLIHVSHAVSAVPIVPIAAKPKNPLEAFQHAFGHPISATPPMVASLPQGLPALPGQPLAAPTSKTVSARHLPIRSHSANLNGKLLTPQHRYGQSAGSPAALPIASYPTGVGFTPGAFSPRAGSGTSTNAVVNGRIIRR